MSDLYFAFGSNMSTARLKERCSSATPVGTAQLPGHLLRFNKRSKDGSGKANVIATGDESGVVWGVLFELNREDFELLDRKELGYERVERRVLRPDCTRVSAWVYVALPATIDDLLKPTAKYLGYLLAGAQEHRLPSDYARLLEAIEVAQ